MALRARQQPVAPKPAPSILFSPVVSDVIPSVIYTMVPTIKEGYEVIHVSYPRALIKSYYPRQILDRYDAMEEIDQKLLWVACVLYKHGGVCFLEPGEFTHEPSTEVGAVTVAYAGSSMLRSYILRSVTGRPVARPIVRPMVVRPMSATPEAKPEARPEARPEAKPEAKPEARPEVRIYILCHNEARLLEAARIYKPYPWAIPIRMKYQDCTFENAFWRQLEEIKDEWSDCTMVGTFSFSAYRKIDLKKVNAIVRDPTQWDSGFYHFCETDKPLTNDHPHLLTIVNEVLLKLGMESPPTAYSNYWIATPSLMAGFINWYETVLYSAVMSHPLILTDAVYKDGKMKQSELMALCNVPYYPHAPFVLERLSICYFKQNTLHKPALYMIGGVDGGGSLKFIYDFIEQFPQTRRIIKKRELNNSRITAIDTVVVQHLLGDITEVDLCRVQRQTGCRLILNIHDFWWFDMNKPHNSYLEPKVKISDAVQELFRCAELIIHPSRFTFDEYAKYFNPANFVVSPHIDFADMESKLMIPPIGNTIRIGAMHDFSECKGKEYINYLMNSFKYYKEYRIKWLVVGSTMDPYKENELFNILKDKQIHCLLLLNKWGETYCYSLSKFLKTGLPILYNAIGAPAERIPDRPHYKHVFDSPRPFDTDAKDLLGRKFESMLDMIVAADKEVDRRPVDLMLRVPPLYDFLFNYQANPAIMKKIHERIKPFCIYFPQFHRIIENDHNYYPGMTDAANLASYLKDTKSALFDTPALCPLAEYDLSRKELVLKQVETATAHGIYGFCVYYYWFSHNSLSDSHTIMEKCYDNFFSETLDNFKIYFNWANENWTKNPAFTVDSSVIISNVYTEEWIRLNFANLAHYFSHPNYYKIDGAPVFSIHHPWFMRSEELAMLERIFTEECRALGFSGIHILKNSMAQTYDKSFLMAPNYKAPRASLEYATYIPKLITADTIHTMFFSFDNMARMYKPMRPHRSKITNATVYQHLKMLTVLINSYKGAGRSELQKLFLINSWNEWGEDMAVEPGVKKGTLYLDMIKRGLMSVL